MALLPSLRKTLEHSALSFEEARAFETGLAYLTPEEQEEFVMYLEQEPDLIYPLYINYKAKLRAIDGGKKEWLAAVETEIVQLEEFLAQRRVGDEIM